MFHNIFILLRVENEINKCSDNRDRTILTDIDPTGRLSKLYDDNLPTFETSQYYYRIVLCLVLHSLMKPNIPVDSIEKHVKILDKVDLSHVERTIVSFSLICHIPYTQDGDLPKSYFDCFEAALVAIEDFAASQRSPCLPYHQAAKCSKTYEYLRTMSLLIASPLHLVTKPRKTALKASLQNTIERLQASIKKCTELIAKRESENQAEKCLPYISLIKSMLELNCAGIL